MGKSKFCEIYLIQENMIGPIKIGRSVSTGGRLASLQTGNPRGLRVIQVYTLSSNDAAEAERLLHEELGEKRLCGEWFDIRENFITAYVPDFFRANGFEFVEGEFCGQAA